MHISEINCSIRWVVTGDLFGLALHYWICQVYDILITVAVTDSAVSVDGGCEWRLSGAYVQIERERLFCSPISEGLNPIGQFDQYY